MKTSSQLETLRMLFSVTEFLKTYLERSRPELAPGKSATVSQLKVVSCIMQSPDGKVRIKDIAAKLGITSGGVSQIVDNLVRDNLVIRNISGEDRRVSWVSLSEEGEKRRREIGEILDALTMEVLSDVPQEKQDIFNEVLSLLSARLEDKLK